MPRFLDVRMLALLAAGALALTACSDQADAPGGIDGKPLAALNLKAAPPRELVSLAPDEVRLRQGQALAITVDGDPRVAASLRFALEDGRLTILREDAGWKLPNKAILDVTMPAPTRLTEAGTGTIRAQTLASGAQVTIAGSGDIETLDVANDRLDVTIAGSGTYRAAGTTRALALVIAGSGQAAMESLDAGAATVEIAGSGRGAFTSSGTVAARIGGSGAVRVFGKPRCRIVQPGPGKLLCES